MAENKNETKITMLTIKEAAALVNGMTEYRVRQMYEVLEILRRTPCACAPLQEAESRLRQMLEQADEDDCQKGVYDFFRKKKGRPPVDKL